MDNAGLGFVEKPVDRGEIILNGKSFKKLFCHQFFPVANAYNLAAFDPQYLLCMGISYSSTPDDGNPNHVPCVASLSAAKYCFDASVKGMV